MPVDKSTPGGNDPRFRWPLQSSCGQARGGWLDDTHYVATYVLRFTGANPYKSKDTVVVSTDPQRIPDFRTCPRGQADWGPGHRRRDRLQSAVQPRPVRVPLDTEHRFTTAASGVSRTKTRGCCKSNMISDPSFLSAFERRQLKLLHMKPERQRKHNTPKTTDNSES